jgi:hypothetical protein
VEIGGWVKAGFQVKSTEDIIISGGVEEKAIIESEKNISIKLGILGNEKTKICCKGNLIAKFIQGAQICTGGNIYVNEYIMNSDVNSGGSIFINGKRGELINSNTSAEISIITNKYKGNKNCKLQVKGFDRSLLITQIKSCLAKRNSTLIEMRKLAVIVRNKQKDKDPYIKEYLEKYRNLENFYQSLETEMTDLREILSKVEGEGMITILSETENISFQIKNEAKSIENIEASTFFYDPKEKKVIKKWDS